MRKFTLPYFIISFFFFSTALSATDPLYYETGGFGTDTDGGLGEPFIK